MTDQHFIILYVNSPALSVGFYSSLLQKPPLETSPSFAMFALGPGLMLGLWDRQGVLPAAPANTGGSELAFALADKDGVDSLYARCRERQVPVAQEPAQMDFGYTFVALDPDGHRLRVFSPSAS